jgi:hypothetical protein
VRNSRCGSGVGFTIQSPPGHDFSYLSQPQPITHVNGTYLVHLRIPKGGGGRMEVVESSRRSWKGDRVANVQGEYQSIPPCVPTETAAPLPHSVNSTSLHPRRSTPTRSPYPPLDVRKNRARMARFAAGCSNLLPPCTLLDTGFPAPEPHLPPP